MVPGPAGQGAAPGGPRAHLPVPRPVRRAPRKPHRVHPDGLRGQRVPGHSAAPRGVLHERHPGGASHRPGDAGDGLRLRSAGRGARGPGRRPGPEELLSPRRLRKGHLQGPEPRGAQRERQPAGPARPARVHLWGPRARGAAHHPSGGILLPQPLAGALHPGPRDRAQGQARELHGHPQGADPAAHPPGGAAHHEDRGGAAHHALRDVAGQRGAGGAASVLWHHRARPGGEAGARPQRRRPGRLRQDAAAEAGGEDPPSVLGGAEAPPPAHRASGGGRATARRGDPGVDARPHHAAVLRPRALRVQRRGAGAPLARGDLSPAPGPGSRARPAPRRATGGAEPDGAPRAPPGRSGAGAGHRRRGTAAGGPHPQRTARREPARVHLEVASPGRVHQARLHREGR